MGAVRDERDADCKLLRFRRVRTTVESGSRIVTR